MLRISRIFFLSLLLLAIGALPACAQHRRDNNFYNGVRHGGRGGNYGARGGGYDGRGSNYGARGGGYDSRGYDRGHYDNHGGGIGPGTGALIGGGGGAILGAIFGGGLKGTIIGGAAGAGIGAVLGQANQNNQDNRYYRH